jgi:hypothetical protein
MKSSNIIIYYSEKCSHCSRLLAENNLESYTLVNIDVPGATIPDYVSAVPTLLDISDKRKYEGTAVFLFVKDNTTIEPYTFNCTNNTNTGFSFINSERPVYSEQSNYAHIDETI